MDVSSEANRISHCTFMSGKVVAAPAGPHGLSNYTVYLEGCNDLVDDNMFSSSYIYGGSIESDRSGAAGSSLGNAFRNNVTWSASPTSLAIIGG